MKHYSKGSSVLKDKLNGSPQKRLHKDLQIKELAWSKLDGDTKKACIWESNSNKEMVVAQFVAESKSNPPITKNR